MMRHIIGKKATRILLLFMAYSLMFPFHIFALPEGGTVVAGQAQIATPDALNMTINQSTSKTIIDWQKFGINQLEAVQFFQPGASSIALNRVVGIDPSIINGLLSANGRIFVINPNGLLVGPTGQINVNSFLASTLDIANEDFLSDRFVFSQSLGQSLASIINQGTITAVEGGSVSLLAPAVRNEGTIVASLGKVYLLAGEQITLSFAENDLIKFAIDESVMDEVIGPDGNPLSDSVSNTGTISADGGEVVLSGKTAVGLVQSVVNNSGIIEAKSLVNQNGVIRLEGDEVNIVQNSGTLDVSGKEEGAKGGMVYVLGSKVGLFGYSQIDASGDKGGGKVLIGGDYQGNNPEIQNAKRTYVSPDASIKADAISEGDGGTVIVWADESTQFYGSISARGGADGGDGGFIETSGRQYLHISGSKVDASAPAGEAGTWLLDPTDVTICLACGTDLSMLPGPIFAPDGTNPATANVDVVDITNALEGGTSVTIQTSGGGANLGTITVDTAINVDLSVTGLAQDVTLTLDADDNITFNLGAVVTVSGSDDVGDKFSLDLQAGGSVTINADINLTPAFGAGATGDFASSGTTFDSTGGAITATNVTLNHSDTVALGPMSVGGTLDVTAGSAITDSGILTVGGTSSFTTTAVNGDITLDQVSLFTGAVSLSTNGATGDISITNVGQAL
ncbi:filamentous hemagglutinin N-terminal domain-containing protein, partial [Patescibacteria group bacterium]|nr:filamentous hemagglutinin N-terminal domain-containing protein [Patescibacteria group bacterium]